MRLGVRIDVQGKHHLILITSNGSYFEVENSDADSTDSLAAHDAQRGWGPLLDRLDGDVGVAIKKLLGDSNAREHQAEGLSLASPVISPPSFRDFYAFEQHVKTARARRGLEVNPAWYREPVFYFSNPNSLVGHEAEVFAPKDSSELDFELELGVVIGKGGRDISLEQAWEHVAGFTVINDFSARDLQRREMSVGLGPAKGKDFATSVGPWIVTRDEIEDKIDTEGKVHLEMSARVNGKEYARGRSEEMYFSWPEIIARASADADLLPGDLIGSGTVGTGCILELGAENVDGWLKPGDVVELEIEHIGVLRNRIIARPDAVA